MDEVFSLPVDQQVRYYLYQLASPLGMMAAIGFIVAMVTIIWLDRAKWMALSLLIFFQTFGFVLKSTGTGINTLAQPLQQIRILARPAAIGVLLLMLIPTFRSFRGRRWNLIHVGTIALFLFELIVAGRFVVGGAYDKGVLGVVVYSVLFLVLGVGLARWLQGPDDAVAAVKAVVWAGTLMLIGTTYQLVVDRSGAYVGGRLAGMTNNPQHLGTVLALMLPAGAYILVRPGESYWWRVTSGVFMGFGFLLLLASGSRLGILMATIGLLLLFRGRLGQMSIMGVVVMLVAYFGSQILGDSAIAGSEHLLNTVNSRTVVWQRGWDTFMNNLWFGSGFDFDQVESSYISAGASTGLIGFVSLLITVFLIGAGMWRLARVRRALGNYTILADLVFGMLAAVLIGSAFEAFLLSTMTDILVLLYVWLGLMALLIDTGVPASEATPGQEAEELPNSHYSLAGVEHGHYTAVSKDYAE